MLSISGNQDLVAEEEGEQFARAIVELSCDEARAFFLKHESYFTTQLPPYFQFNGLLNEVSDVLEGKQLNGLCRPSPRRFDKVNHTILTNKDGRFAWRPLELIHPAIYVSLIHNITEKAQWQLICDRFSQFRRTENIRCMSLPVESLTEMSDDARQISHWWSDVEQKSIELGLDYEFIIRTDITDCYANIYTHSIAWALHSKELAKAFRGPKDLIGNIIDNHIQDMQQGQTNGIPQGPKVMDFIAEMVLGYADSDLVERIRILDAPIDDYQIIRYRDDYRIFVNSRNDGECILKCLTEVLIDLGLQLNPSKTDISGDVIQSSIKTDKLGWIFRRQSADTLQKSLLIIHDHGMKFPNSGSLRRALRDYYETLVESKSGTFPLPLISIVVDIAYRNPGTYPVTVAILSKLIDLLEVTTDEKRRIIESIKRRFSGLPNTGYMQIWLQRISMKFAQEVEFDDPLCRLVSNEGEHIWNNDWISYRALLNAVDARKVIDSEEIEKLSPVVPIDEIDLFSSQYE